MSYDRIVVLCVGVFFILFSLIIRFVIVGIIKKSKNRSEPVKTKERKNAKVISIFLVLIGLYWIVLFIFYDSLF